MVPLLTEALLLPTAFVRKMVNGKGCQVARVGAARRDSACGQAMGRAGGDRMPHGSAQPWVSQIGRIGAERLHGASGSLMGRMDGEQPYDAWFRQIGRADGLRCMQLTVLFYFLM